MSTGPHQLQTLVRYKRWANQKIFAELATLSSRDLESPQPIVFGSLIGTLHHIFAMDETWQAHLLGQPHGYTTRHPKGSPSLETLSRKQGQIDNWYLSYADSLTDDMLPEVIAFEFIGGGEGSMTRAEILLHVVNHGTYHRGHVSTMMYQFGSPPPATDFPVYLRDGQD